MNKRYHAGVVLLLLLSLLSGCKRHRLLTTDYGKYELRDYYYSEWPYFGHQWDDRDDFCLKGTDECVYYGEAEVEKMGPIAVVSDPNTLAFFNMKEGFQYSCHYQVYGKQGVHFVQRGNFNLVYIEVDQEINYLDYKDADTYLYELKFDGRQCVTQSLIKQNKGVIFKNDSVDESSSKHSYAWEWCDENCYVSWKSENSYDIKTIPTNCDPSIEISLEWKEGKPVMYSHKNTGNTNAKCDLEPF